MAATSGIETDYLVVGAGALGMAFVDALIGQSDADVVMVERRHHPGGHWLDAYPFVQLHQPSRFYGVDSTALGDDRPGRDGADDGFYERASGTGVCTYFDEVMRRRFLATGRVRFFPLCDYLADGCFRSRVTGRLTEVTVRRRLVDATYMASRVPATDPPPFEVADGVQCVPVGGLATLESAPGGFVIVGGGKTALDAICWLLDRDCAPESITWIRPRDTWVLNRAFFQPGELRTFEGIILQMEAMVASASVEEVYERLEGEGVMWRTDRAVVPEMMKGATVSAREMQQLVQIKNVVRLGRVERIEPRRIVLERGEVPTTPGAVHVHCAAPGLSDNPPKPIFEDGAMTLQLVTRVALTLSGALQGFVESTGRTTQEKNRLCLPTAMPHTPFDYLRAVAAGITLEMGWGDAPDLRDWLEGSRLNLLSGLSANGDASTVKELQRRFFASLFPALEKFEAFASRATERERSRMFQPSGTAGSRP